MDKTEKAAAVLIAGFATLDTVEETSEEKLREIKSLAGNKPLPKFVVTENFLHGAEFGFLSAAALIAEKLKGEDLAKYVAQAASYRMAKNALKHEMPSM